MTDEQLTALLRLKRFEQPPPQYFERLLDDVHRRQREELLRQPLWKIAVERVQTFFSEHSMGSLSYAGAMATALAIGVGSIWMLAPVEPPQIAEARPQANLQPKTGRMLNLGITAPVALRTEFATPTWGSANSVSAKDPRYVLDARPPSYEPEASIEF